MRKIFHKLASLEEAVEIVEKYAAPTGVEKVGLLNALGRILASDVYAKIDSPPFDRSLMDGYAVRAEDIYQADESNPVKLKLIGFIEVGKPPQIKINPGECAEIATGAPIPPGANAVAMIEYTKKIGDEVLFFRGVKPGEGIAQTGSDITAGDLVMRKGRKLTSREIAVLAALGYSEVEVYRKPRAAIFSIGNELTPPSCGLPPAKIYDVNSYSILSMLRELGLEGNFLGILPDDFKIIYEKISEALNDYDLVISSGSTSAGLGDVVYQAFEKLGRILVHGIKVKPGKPTVIAISHNGKLMIGLPGFPLSSMMIFTVIIKPAIIKMTGLETRSDHLSVSAKLPFRINVGGRAHLIPIQLVESPMGLYAYPRLGDSGSTSALLEADGFIMVPEEKQFLEKEEEIEVKLFHEFRPPSIYIIGSHCPGIDVLVQVAGIRDVKIINVGSLGGWMALKRGEADVAGTHLLDEDTMRYNVHIPEKLGIEDEVEIYGGYTREVGFVTAPGNPKGITDFRDLLRRDVVFVNRVKGSGIRTYIDIQLKKLGVKDPEKQINGYTYQARTHTAVAAAILQGRADVGVAIGYVAKLYGLEFIPLTEEYFDIAVRKDRLSKTSVKKLIESLGSRKFAEEIREMPHYKTHEKTGKRIFP
ncbi:MAG: molybdopterin biosynthesis protein [Nitrososphaeria archaeon]|nr:molybdopterin biosynthesis protein [Nitrososphaeria archaeon]